MLVQLTKPESLTFLKVARDALVEFGADLCAQVTDRVRAPTHRRPLHAVVVGNVQIVAR